MAENGMRNSLEQSNDSNGGTVAITNGLHNHEHDQTNEKIPSTRLSETAQKYMQELLIERGKLENNFPLAVKLIDEAIERVQLNGRIPTRDQYADVYQQRTIKLTQKVHVPIKDKKFNYVGKLLGPKGNSLRRLQEETQCKIVILGRFSMKDRAREEELRNSADAKYAHLNLPLHVEVSAIAPPAEAYARVAYALAELRRYLTPDKYDDIRQEQFRELMEDPESAKKITLKQQQHQQQSGGYGNSAGAGGASGGGAGGGGGVGVGGGGGGGGGITSNMNHNSNHRSNNSGNYRPKYQQAQQSQNYHHNDDGAAYAYRSHNIYHPAKQFLPGIIGGSASGMTVVNAAGYNGRAPGIMTNTAGAGGTNNCIVGGAPNSNPNVRYRPSQLPYHFIKK